MGIEWRGAWSAAVAYSPDDAVQFEGSSWVAVGPNTNSEPDSSPDWNLLAARGADGGGGFVQLGPVATQSSATLPLIDVASDMGLGIGDAALLDISHSGGAESLLQLANDGGLVASGVEGNGVVPASGAGARMVWYPGKYAFRAGKVDSFGATYWNENNIGSGSAAFGENARASGNSSFAAGLATTASGDESVALGNNGTASADRAFSFNGTASAVGAVAIGSGAQATVDDALALGPSSIAGGLASVAIGPSMATGNFGIAIGLQNSASGQFSVAIGKNARTEGFQGSVVIGDGCASFSSDSVRATANNQFVVRGCGGLKMYTSQNLSSGVEVAPGGGAWASISDRRKKENFVEVDGEDVLRRLRSVPVEEWNYRTQGDDIRHIGPMAQDFHAAFGLGDDDVTISTVDADGVALAAVKALDVRTEVQTERIALLEAENAALIERIERLEALLLEEHEHTR